jgi:hypothetical protein
MNATQQPLSLRTFVNVARTLLQSGTSLREMKRFNSYVDVDIYLYTHSNRAEPQSADELQQCMRDDGIRDASALRCINEIWSAYVAAKQNLSVPITVEF